MKPAQQLIDEVRRFLKGSRRDLTPGVEELFSEFREQSAVANQRLRNCLQLISTGFPAEAIQRAEEQPPVVELAAVLGSLDEAELHEVNEILSFNDQPTIDPIALDCLDHINDVYNQYAGVADLLSQFRLMNLQRRPLKERLQKLRQICQQQSDDLSWANDLKAFEQARIAEIQSDYRAAVKNKDNAMLAELADEVNRSAWTIAVPSGLAQTIRGASVQVERGQSSVRLREISSSLFDALNSRDLEDARRLTLEWDELQRRAQLPADDPAVIQSSPAREWVAGENRRSQSQREFNEQLQKFERLLFASSGQASARTHDQLQQTLNQLERHDFEIPERLMRRYEQLNKDYVSTRGKKRMAIAVGAAVLMLLIAVGIGWAAVSYQDQTRMTTAIASVEAMLDQGDVAGARKLYDQQAGAWTDPAWVGMSSAIDTLANQRESLITRLNQWYLDAGAADTMGQLDGLITQAKGWYEGTVFKSTLDPDFQTKVLQIRQKLSQQIAEREAIVRGEIQNLQAQLTKLDLAARNVAAPDEYAALDRKITAEIAQTEKKLVGLNPSLSEQLAAVRSTCSQLRLENMKIGQQRDMIRGILAAANIPDSSGQPEQSLKTYFENLAQFVTKFPNDPLSAQFQNVPSRGTLEQILAWQSLVRRHGGLEPSTKPDCEQRLAQLSDFERKVTDPAIANRVKELRAYWEHILARDEQSLARFMTARHMSGVYFLDVNDFPRVGDVTRYYTKEREQYSGSIANIKFFRMKNGVYEEDIKSVHVDKLRSKTPLLSPHAKLADEIREAVRSIRIPDWEKSMQDLLTKVYTTEQIDPILKGRLVYDLLQVASQGSVFLETHLKEFIDRFDNDRFDFNVDWTDPANEFASTHREYATTLLKGIPLETIVARFADAELDKKAFLSQREGLFSVVGAILPDQEQKLQPQFSVDPGKLRASEILILRRAGEVDELLPVGSVQQGSFHPTATSFDTLGGVLLLARPKESTP
jgi:hypothetical protein